MSKIQFQLESLDGLVRTLQSMAGEHEDMSRSLQSHAGSAQSIGADGWIVDQLRYASSLLGGHPDLFRMLSSELAPKLELAHKAADLSSGGPTALRAELTLAMTATAGLLKAVGASKKANQLVNVVAKKTIGTGAASSRALTAQQIADNLANLATLRPMSQFGSSYKNPSSASSDNLDWSHGGDNCGPTSLAMVITFYERQKHPPSTGIAPVRAANWVRGGGGDFEKGASENYYKHNTPTDFGLYSGSRESDPVKYDTAQSSRTLLDHFGLLMAPEDQVHDIDSLRAQLDLGHPVVIRVDNDKYASAGMSGATSHPALYAGMTDVLTSHVVVVTGYDVDANGEMRVHIDDPLAGYNWKQPKLSTPPSNFQITANELTKAAGGNWEAAGVSPKSEPVAN